MASPALCEAHGAAEPVPGEYGRNEEALFVRTPTPTPDSRDKQEAPSPTAPAHHNEPGKIESDQQAAEAADHRHQHDVATETAEAAQSQAAAEETKGDTEGGVAATAPLEAAAAPNNDSSGGKVVMLAHVDVAGRAIMKRMQNHHEVKEGVYLASLMQPASSKNDC